MGQFLTDPLPPYTTPTASQVVIGIVQHIEPAAHGSGTRLERREVPRELCTDDRPDHAAVVEELDQLHERRTRRGRDFTTVLVLS